MKHTSEPVCFEEKDGNPNHKDSQDAINNCEVVCRAGVIQVSTNNQRAAQNAKADRQMFVN